MLGLSRRAGSLIIGTDLVTKSLPSGKVLLVIYAENSSPNTEKKITDKCSFYNVNCTKAPFTGDELAHAIGKTASVCVVGVTDKNFSKELFSLISKETR